MRLIVTGTLHRLDDSEPTKIRPLLEALGLKPEEYIKGTAAYKTDGTMDLVFAVTRSAKAGFIRNAGNDITHKITDHVSGYGEDTMVTPRAAVQIQRLDGDNVPVKIDNPEAAIRDIVQRSDLAFKTVRDLLPKTVPVRPTEPFLD
jgi:hypothetical protein